MSRARRNLSCHTSRDREGAPALLVRPRREDACLRARLGTVIPAQAGIQHLLHSRKSFWMPAFAGMTKMRIAVTRAKPFLRAFTLVEVLIAIALIIAVAGTSFTFFHNLLQSRERLLEEAARQRSATILLDQLEGALLTAIAGDERNGAGVTGDNASISILTRGVATYVAENGLRDPGLFSDLQRIEFRFDASSGIIEARETVVPTVNRDRSSAAGRYWPIGAAAVVRFRYHDGSMWVDSFDSRAAGRLPAAVEIAIRFEPWPGEIESASESTDDEAGAFDGESVESDSRDDERAFDEEDFALRSEMELYFETPRPDRVRVIASPDSEPADESESVEFEGEEDET